MQNLKKLYELCCGRAVLITNPKDIYYLTGANFDGFWLLTHKKNVFAVTSEMVKNQAEEYFGKKIAVFASSSSLSSSIIEICKKNKIKEVNADSNIMKPVFDAVFENLKKNGITLKTVPQITKYLRSVKARDEIKNIKKACNIISAVYVEIKKFIKPGMTELDIYFKIAELFAKYKVEPSFKTIVASGPNSANPHHSSNNRKILKNDMILIDMGCMYKGYCSDLTRIVFLGKINLQTQKILALVKYAHEVSLKTVKSGLNCSLVDNSARNIIEKAGYGANFVHGTGHGVGLDIHEYPSVSEKSKDTLKENMVITIEPGVYFNGKFGIRIEDTVLVTKNGYKVLTSAQY